MELSKRHIRNGFWAYSPIRRFPPNSINYPDQYKGKNKLNLVCTQFNGISSLKADDKTLLPLCEIKSLVNLRFAQWWDVSELKILRNSLPKLKYGTPIEGYYRL